MKAWFVVRTKTGAEDRAAWHLKNQGFEVYLPRYSKVIRHARKTQTVLRPVFPGYLFVSISLKQQQWRAINSTVGVIGLVQFGNAPCAVADSIVDMIRTQEQNGVVNLALNGLKKGDVVRIQAGAFAEHMALLEEVSGDRRAILLLDLMGREVRVQASVENLAKAS
ncbi:MAG: transcriptional activator RfaH [Rhodospirillaceae bacterium]|nr:MAG: transcriptional activator RfaH [Rhodospirillaceae bacterium]